MIALYCAGSALLAAAVTYVLVRRKRDRLWLGVIEQMNTAKRGETVARICRTCAPNAKVQRGEVVLACPHGGVVPRPINDTLRSIK